MAVLVLEWTRCLVHSCLVENLPFRLARLSRILSDRTDRSMVAQPAAAMAAGSSSGEEAAAGTGPAPQEIQEQAAPSMMAMLALLVEKVGGLQETVDQVSARTMALEGALADVSLSDSGGPPTGSGSVSAAPSLNRL